MHYLEGIYCRGGTPWPPADWSWTMRKFLSSKFLLVALVIASLCTAAPAQKLNSSNDSATSPVKLTLPLKDGSLRFAVIGDTGSGSSKQSDVGNMMVQYRAAFPFEFVLMMGDNLYGGETPQDFEK